MPVSRNRNINKRFNIQLVTDGPSKILVGKTQKLTSYGVIVEKNKYCRTKAKIVKVIKHLSN